MADTPPLSTFALCSHVSFMVVFYAFYHDVQWRSCLTFAQTGKAHSPAHSFNFCATCQNKTRIKQPHDTMIPMPEKHFAREMLKSVWHFMASTPGSSPGNDLAIQNRYQPRSQRLVYSISKGGGTVRLFTNQVSRRCRRITGKILEIIDLSHMCPCVAVRIEKSSNLVHENSTIGKNSFSAFQKYITSSSYLQSLLS